MGILEKLKINKKQKAEKEKVEDKKETVKKTVAETETKTAVKSTSSKSPKGILSGKSKGSKLYHRILLHPVVTEKSATQESGNKYSFIVNVKANKGEIIRSVVEAYGVKPLSVRTMIVEGKRKRYGRFSGNRSAYKKAVVTVPKGKTIDIHEGV